MSSLAQYYRVAGINDIPQGRGRCFTVAGRRIAVFRVEDELFAIDDRCTHAEASLSEGQVWGCEVECPRHGATFDLRTGRPTLPAVKKIQLFEAAVEDGRVVVTLHEA